MPPPLPQKYLRILCGVPTPAEHLTRCSEFECAVSSPIILKHLVSSVVSLAQLVSPSVALPAEVVCLVNPLSCLSVVVFHQYVLKFKNV